MKKTLIALVVATMVIAVGCKITTTHKIEAHIVVDIRHINEQADDILDFIEGETDELPGVEDGASWMDRSIDALMPMPVAYAASLKTSSPLLTQIAKKMKARNAKVTATKATGAVGETNRGYLKIEKAEKIKGAEKKNEIQRLIAAENEDRKNLYNEVARLNKSQKVTLKQIEAIYAQARLSRAKAGALFQLPPAGGNFNKFKASPAGKKLGAACKPDAWVIIK